MMSELLKIETLKSLLGSWTLLVTITLCSVVLWWLPSQWFGDPAVAAIRDQYRGYIGLVAIAFSCALVIKGFLALAKGLWRLKTSVQESRRKKEHAAVSHAKILAKIARLPEAERELLMGCVQTGNPKFMLHPEDARVKNLHNIGAIGCVDYDRELSSFEIHSWVWKDLQAKIKENSTNKT